MLCVNKKTQKRILLLVNALLYILPTVIKKSEVICHSNALTRNILIQSLLKLLLQSFKHNYMIIMLLMSPINNN